MDFIVEVLGQDLTRIYIMALIVSVFVKKEVNSHMLTSACVCLYSILSGVLGGTLLALTKEAGVDMGRVIWYGGFSLANLLLIMLMYKAHVRLNVSTGKTYALASSAYMCFIFVQLVGYIDAAFFQSVILDKFYRISVVSLNISVALIVILGVKERGRFVRVRNQHDNI